MMRRITLLLIGLVLLAAPMQAQNRPLSASTLTTTDTSANSLLVGCEVGTTTCTGGIKSGTITTSNTGASSLDVGGGINAGTGNVQIVGTDGRIPDISSTTFASLSGANLTAIPETAITDGSILARVAANETITGAWTYTNGTPITLSGSSGTGLAFVDTSQASGSRRWDFALFSNNFHLRTTDDGGGSASNVFRVSRSGGSPTLFEVFPALAISASLGSSTPALTFSGDTNTGLVYTGADAFAVFAGGIPIETYSASTGMSLGAVGLSLPGNISTTLSAGNNNDLNPAGWSNTYTLRLTADSAGSTLTGLAALPAGTVRQLCNTMGTTGAITLAHDVTSTAANRFYGTATLAGSAGTNRSCATVWYDGTTSRWRVN